MFRFSVPVLVIAAAIVGADQCHAQSESVFVGPAIGLERGSDFGRLPAYNFSSECGELRHGATTTARVGAQLVLPDVLAPRLGFEITSGLSLGYSRLVGEPAEPVRVPTSNTLVELDREFRLAARRTDLLADLTVRYSLGERLSIGAGAVVSLALASAYTITDNILGPGDNSFADGQRERPLPNASRFTASSVQFAPVLRGSYRTNAGGLDLVPSVSIKLDALSGVNEAPWRRISVGVGLAALFRLGEPDLPTRRLDAPLDPRPAALRDSLPAWRPRPLLTASVRLFGLDDRGEPLPVTTVKVREVLYRQHAPLLPTIFFDRDSVDLPSRYVRRGRSGANAFTMDELADLDIDAVQRHVLDVVGARMRRDPAARLEVVGYTSGDEPAALALARAARVKAYLDTAWRIRASRITIVEQRAARDRSSEATEDGRADNRRVELIASRRTTFAPVVTEQIVREFTPPMISMRRAVTAEAGERKWDLTILQGERVVVSHSGRADGGARMPEFNWQIDRDAIDTALPPLVAELVVEDSTGQTTTARDVMPLVLEKRLQTVDGRIVPSGDTEQLGFALVGFAYNAADVDRRNTEIIRDLAALLRPGARVVVTGYADRIGMEHRNAELSAERARRVGATLRAQLDARGVADVTIRSVGSGADTERYPNDYPEGRALSRGVYLFVEQPAGPAPADP